MKNSNAPEEQNKENLYLFLDYISNMNNKKNKFSQNIDENKNKKKIYKQIV